MSTVKVVTPSGKGGKNVELPAEFFGVKVNIPLIHQVVVAQQAAARQGSHATIVPVDLAIRHIDYASGDKQQKHSRDQGRYTEINRGPPACC